MLRRALSLSASYSAGLLRRPHASAPCCHLLLRPLDAPRFLPKKVAGEGKHTNVPAIWFSVVPATRNGAYNSLLDLNQRTGLLLGKRFVSTAVATGTTDPPGERFKCQHETRGRLCKTLEKRNILDHKRRLLASKYELRRKLHKAFCRDPDLPSDMRDKHRYKLSKLPKNSSFVRVRNRCISTGRPRSVYRLFRMSRIVFREKASQGSLMGIKKSSW